MRQPSTVPLRFGIVAALACAALCTWPVAGQAQSPATGLSFNGFGTAGLVATDNGEAHYRSDARQSRGAGTTPDPGVDSKLGLQATWRLDQTFSVVGQLLMVRRTVERPVVEWLYADAQLPAGFSAKLGRMVLPVFMLSDTRSVGYASHWIRPPGEVYMLHLASYFDGGQLQFRNPVGPIHLTAQVSGGSGREGLYFDNALYGRYTGRVHMTGIRAFNLMAEWEDWSLRLGRTYVGGSEIEGIPIPLLDSKDTFTNVGLRYDDHTALVMAEYVTRRNPQSPFYEVDAWYLTAGWRFGNWMPYVSASGLSPGERSVFNSSATRAVGVRWDFKDNAALKLQVDRTNWQPSFVQSNLPFILENPKVQVYSVAVDFMF